MRPSPRRLDAGAIFVEAWGMARRDVALLAGIAGMFLVLPQFVQTLVVAPPPTWPGAAADGAAWSAWIDAVSQWGARNDPILIALALVAVFAGTALLALYLDRPRPTVAGALRLALVLLPRFVLLALAVAVPVNVGVLLLLLPGLWIKGRLFVAGAALMEAPSRGVGAAWRRSVALTRGHTLVLVGLACVPLLAGNLLAFPFEAAMQASEGAPAVDPVAAGLLGIVASVLRAACAVAAILLEIVVYRRLSSGT